MKTQLSINTPFGEQEVNVTYHWESAGREFDGLTDYPWIDEIVPIFEDESEQCRSDVTKYIIKEFDECAEDVVNKMLDHEG